VEKEETGPSGTEAAHSLGKSRKALYKQEKKKRVSGKENFVKL